MPSGVLLNSMGPQDWLPICGFIGKGLAKCPGGPECLWTFDADGRHWYIEVSPDGVAYTFTPDA